MARGTKKVGIAGKFGPRYGVTIRKRIKEVSKHRQSPAQCPECKHHAVKRESSGIWKCRHCKLVFAAGAYSTRLRSFKKDESVRTEDVAYREEYVEEEPKEAEPEMEMADEEPVEEEPVIEAEEELPADDEPVIEEEPKEADDDIAADDVEA